MQKNVNLGSKGSFKVNKGALHRATHTPEGQKIPANKMAAASHSQDPHVRRMAASAKGFRAMHHPHIPGNDDHHGRRDPNHGGGPVTRNASLSNRGGGPKSPNKGGKRGHAANDIARHFEHGGYGGAPVALHH